MILSVYSLICSEPMAFRPEYIQKASHPGVVITHVAMKVGLFLPFHRRSSLFFGISSAGGLRPTSVSVTLFSFSLLRSIFISLRTSQDVFLLACDGGRLQMSMATLHGSMKPRTYLFSLPSSSDEGEFLRRTYRQHGVLGFHVRLSHLLVRVSGVSYWSGLSFLSSPSFASISRGF